jgi:hypothetical protein
MTSWGSTWRISGALVSAGRSEVGAHLGGLPPGLRICDGCGEVRGTTPSGEKSMCLCDGLVCRDCGRRAVRRPISNYFDPDDGGWWHVPWFAATGMRCRDCWRARKERGVEGF